MANAEHVRRLKRGVNGWNQWRCKNPSVPLDLQGVELTNVDLSCADLQGANLSCADLRGADLSYVVLRGADLRRADLRGTNLRRADLSGADLSGLPLNCVDLSCVNLHGANLCDVDLSGFDLSEFDLSDAKLNRANLSKVQALKTNFERAVFTGACLEDWNINSDTKFEDAICEYVYLKSNQKGRRPREGAFKAGEFAALFQQALDTVDLIFKDGIDWQAFFQTFQDLRSQYADQDLSIQAIEKKQGDAFVVRLEMSKDVYKPAIESSARELYETKLALIEQRYLAELRAKKGEVFAYRQQTTNLMETIKLLASRPITVEATAVAETQPLCTEST